MSTDAWRAARETAAFAVLADRAHITVAGKHRDRFLHAMTTAAVKGLARGRGNFGLAVDRGGKLVGQFMMDVQDDDIRLETAADRRDAIIDHLVAHRIADRVTFEPLDGLAVLTVVGPAAAATVAAALGTEPELSDRFAWCEGEIAGCAVRVRDNDTRLGLPGRDLTVAPSDVEAVTGALTAAGAVELDAETFDALRIHAGVPRDEVDMGADNVPLESQHLYDLMDWDKGCYIGQEVIAMMHYRGRPNRHLRALLLPAGTVPPAPGSEVQNAAGKTVGVVGSATTSADVAEGPVVLAVLKRRHAEAGTRLTIGDGVVAVCQELPLATCRARAYRR